MNNKPNSEKLQKLIAQTGRASRREAERWIEAGRVKVNGRIAQLGDRALPTDRIEIDGKPIKSAHLHQEATEVLLYNKPEGVVCSRKDDKGRPTIFEQMPKRHHGRWISVGRLDVNTSGLLLMTNNGELANRLMHPRYALEREYAVRVLGELTPEQLRQLREGVQLDDGMAKFKRITPMPGETEGKNRWYKVVLTEGRNREVRRLFAALGLTVNRLIRIRYGQFSLPRNLGRGRTRPLTWRQVNMLLRSVGLPQMQRPDLRSSSSPDNGHQRRKRR
ncbi:MAG TPA: rRNA pseudouridine synthase [Piscirickettsiaceae bacterium]|nr:rRNA pseudouridine synthase [Piscirickettsiaceae bacterium]